MSKIYLCCNQFFVHFYNIRNIDSIVPYLNSLSQSFILLYLIFKINFSLLIVNSLNVQSLNIIWFVSLWHLLHVEICLELVWEQWLHNQSWLWMSFGVTIKLPERLSFSFMNCESKLSNACFLFFSPSTSSLLTLLPFAILDPSKYFEFECWTLQLLLNLFNRFSWFSWICWACSSCLELPLEGNSFTGLFFLTLELKLELDVFLLFLLLTIGLGLVLTIGENTLILLLLFLWLEM